MCLGRETKKSGSILGKTKRHRKAMSHSSLETFFTGHCPKEEVPYNITDSKRLKFSNESKTHSYRVATLEKHCGNVNALIYGQCTQILQDNMTQDKNRATVSVSYKPLELYKLIERVILKQTEDQYPVAALWEQLTNVVNAKQGNLTNNKMYDWFNTKVEVAKSVGVNFDFKKIWEYCAQEVHKAA